MHEYFLRAKLRHKSVKASFRASYWATVAMHCAGACGIWWFSQNS